MTTDYLLWALLLVGWVYAITEAAITSWVRILVAEHFGVFFETLIYCPSCTGFWVGVGLAATGWWPHGTTDNVEHTLLMFGESAIAAMGVAATWSKLTGGSAAWQIERGALHDQTTTIEEGKES
jgi:hypothetical protein